MTQLNEVIELDEKRPHYTKKATCVWCIYEWVAVYPAYAEKGTFNFECPKCGAMAQHITVDI